MRISPRLRTILMCAMLEYAALVGSPMRPDEIEKLLQTMNQPKVSHVMRDENRD
jgi:pyridoxal/pyridoxine/pyridoxamine kinase